MEGSSFREGLAAILSRNDAEPVALCGVCAQGGDGGADFDRKSTFLTLAAGPLGFNSFTCSFDAPSAAVIEKAPNSTVEAA